MYSVKNYFYTLNYIRFNKIQGQIIGSKTFTHIKQNYISQWSYIISIVNSKNDTSVTIQSYCFVLNTYY